jgi:transcription initiation factor IIE alpha subunit
MGKKFICKDCGEEFELTAEGKQIYKDNNFSDPMSCCQCSIIKDLRRGQIVKDYAKVKTDSKYWTPERKAAYETSLSQLLNNEQSSVRKI